MQRRIRVSPLRRLRRFLTIHEPELWELMAAMAYASPVALFPYTELARDGAFSRYDDNAWQPIGPSVTAQVSGDQGRTPS